MNIKDIEDLKKAYPILANKMEVNFPNSFSNINKVLDFINNVPEAERLIKNLLVRNIDGKKEDMHHMNINNANDLKKAYLDLVNEIIRDALAEERNYNLEKSNKIRQSISAENNIIANIATGANGSKRRGNK